MNGLDLPHTGVRRDCSYGSKGGSIGTDGLNILTLSTFYSNYLPKTTTTITESFLY